MIQRMPSLFLDLKTSFIFRMFNRKLYYFLIILKTYAKLDYCCSVAQSCQLFATPWTAACQASLSFINSQFLLKFVSIESVMPSNHLILCCRLLLPPSIFPRIRVFSKVLTLRKVLELQLQHQSFQ